MSDINIDKVEEKIKLLYGDYKDIYANLTKITNEISDLEKQRNDLLEKDGRRFLFTKPAIELKGFIQFLKSEKWVKIEYEGFEEGSRPDIVDEAMIVEVYCFQANHTSPVKFVFMLSGYLSFSEYEMVQKKHPGLPEYYIDKEGEKDG